MNNPANGKTNTTNRITLAQGTVCWPNYLVLLFPTSKTFFYIVCLQENMFYKQHILATWIRWFSRFNQLTDIWIGPQQPYKNQVGSKLGWYTQVSSSIILPWSELGDCIPGSWRLWYRPRWRLVKPPWRRRRCRRARRGDSPRQQIAGTLSERDTASLVAAGKQHQILFGNPTRYVNTYTQWWQNLRRTLWWSRRQMWGKVRPAVQRRRRTPTGPGPRWGGCWRSGRLSSSSTVTPVKDTKTLSEIRKKTPVI